ncbi:hypothetical protein MicloDRAFT_00033950 [Microvirga lotononidis]|uniref:Uncharacterized protein n=1 Tax=Microvirga lotononidis TaxID=864069 RepID=I4YSA2_9HYPH|nr:hypothetical protein MicloDRAFT_00033950 [Microvirga lotononidis]
MLYMSRLKLLRGTLTDQRRRQGPYGLRYVREVFVAS